MTTRRRDERGVVAIIAVLVVSLVGLTLAAFVVDIGYTQAQRRQAQAAADSAALAGTSVVISLLRQGIDPKTAASRTQIANAVRTFGANNWSTSTADWTGCSATLPTGFEKVETASASNCIAVNWTDKKIKVQMPLRTMPRLFAQRTLQTAASAVTAWSEVPPGCGLCVLGDGPHGIQNGNVLVSDANIAFNGTLAINNGSVGVTNGTFTVEDGASGTFTPTAPTVTHEEIKDPLASFTPPTLPTNHPSGGPCVGGPGVYGDWSTWPSTCTLSAGLYVVVGQWKMASTGEAMLGSGVTLYFACGTVAAPRECNVGESGGNLQQNGGTLKITPPLGATDPLRGLLMMYSRNNTAEFRLRGNGDTLINGTIYAQSAALDINGLGAVQAMDSLIVVGSLQLGGSNGTVKATYTQANNMAMPGGAHLDE